MNNYVSILRTSPKCQGKSPVLRNFRSLSRTSGREFEKNAREVCALGRLLRGQTLQLQSPGPHECTCRFRRLETRMNPETHAGRRTDRRVPGHLCAHPVWHRSGRDGRAVPHEESGGNHSWRLYQHHTWLGTRRDDGNLYRRKNFRSTPESRGDAGPRRISQDFPGAKFCPTPSPKLPERSPLPLSCTGTTRPAFMQVDPQLDHTAGVFTTFPRLPGLPQAGFLDQFIGTGLLVLLILPSSTNSMLPRERTLRPR